MLNIMVEGARGVGKSSITQYIRSQTTNSTLINFTGFNEKGDKGLTKALEYYSSWGVFFHKLRHGDYTFIHDRYFFSEMVYSKLYKDYNFEHQYANLVNFMRVDFDKVKLILLVTKNEETLRDRLMRDKVELFGEVEESVYESMKQQSEYLKIIKGLKEYESKKFSIHKITVDNKTVKEIGDEILKLL